VTSNNMVARCSIAVVALAYSILPAPASPQYLLAQAVNPASSAPQSSSSPAENKPANSDPAGGTTSAGSAATARKPVKLYGRIEELCTTPGAKFPLKLQALTPKLDARGSLSAGVRNQAIIGSAPTYFPTDWAGVFSGTLKVWTAQFDPVLWQFDAEETSQEQDLIKPGTEGQVSFDFTTGGNQHIELEPAQVVFTAPMTESRYKHEMQAAQQQMQQMMGNMPGMQEMFNGSGTGGAMMQQIMQSVPYMFALHLGNLTQGTGVTGNLLEARLVKNDVKVLSATTLEQQVITYNQDVNKSTGRRHFNFTENVLRFTKLNRDQLYVQAASVDYDRNGKFESKVVLYGTVNRGQASSPMLQGMPSMNGMPTPPNLNNLFNLGQ